MPKQFTIVDLFLLLGATIPVIWTTASSQVMDISLLLHVSTLLTLTGGKNLLLMLSINAFSVQFSCFNVPSSVVRAQEFNKL